MFLCDLPVTGTTKGSGTITSPLRFGKLYLDDLLMQLAGATNVRIFLAPGEYLTRGVAQKPAYLREGWAVIGSGRHRTKVTVTDFIRDRPIAGPPPLQGGFNIAFTTWYQNANHVEVRDLTIDCNYPELSKIIPRLGLAGVCLHGSGNTIYNVDVINSAGMRCLEDGSNQENFPITAGSWTGPADHVIIDGCRVFDVKGGYTSAISLMANPDPPAGATVSGEVRECDIHLNGFASEFGLNMSGVKHVSVRDNEVRGATRCLSNDSSENDDVVVRDNYFAASQCGVFMLSSSNGMLYRNTIDLLNAGCAGIVMYSQGAQSCSDWIVCNNIVRNLLARDQSYGIMTGWNGSPPPKRICFVSNLIDESLDNLISTKAGVFVSNMTFKGTTPKGFPNLPGLV